ncbi:hypothetical protein KUTeg_019675 [Tegillarca granosa]|uniref:Temptin Cys/Cys disulfide domain-containing protein n=1 Tax=Tegillarca granosa TaxID=220873 RepID=A0ABQ9EDA6_TEGGR|nr:hypothetical protein KUTeg_019675 [Tegillarca granosa]
MKIHIAFLISLSVFVLGHPGFRDKLPNGYAVPNPCPSSLVWNAVGHYNPNRFTAILNPFDADFGIANLTWTRELCMKDSDKDGKTNGEELGDPHCVWTEGKQPHGGALSHPGICEPVDSRNCSYQHFHCDCLEHCHDLVGHRIH